ncbi:MAG: ammonia channel protein, partial [Burkholderiaceae bacterium]|nr:ammonia channel protein [Burkholderiaceae bacterium]
MKKILVKALAASVFMLSAGFSSSVFAADEAAAASAPVATAAVAASGTDAAASAVAAPAPATATEAAASAPAAAEAPAPTPNKGDTSWMMTATMLVILMTIPGLALFYGGLVRSKNMLSILMQVFMIFAVIIVLWCIYG